MRRRLLTSGAVALLVAVWTQPALTGAAPDMRLFFEAASTDEKTARAAFASIVGAGWRDAYAPLLIDIARFLPSPRAIARGDEPPAAPDDEVRPGPQARFPESGTTTAATPRARARERLIRFLEERTAQRFGQDLKKWRKWIWQRKDEPHPDYARFKATLYASAVDPKMAAFFSSDRKAAIRLDEIDWGGVAVNGIPPLDHPKAVRASEATYLQDKNVVFGIEVAGEARAYPKRILGWHEMALDRLGGAELTIVYCTLCGTVIPYASEVAGRRFTFGTSGLLYRSNKLMFDDETKSLWSAVDGTPVVGPLAGSGLTLEAFPVVTTTWREWREAHPETTVLSLETGFHRDYSEGAAYRDYFATDALMFEVPGTDSRLKNKAEVLALLLPSKEGAPSDRLPVAFSAEFLKRRSVYQGTFGAREIVVLTAPGGANRAYEAGGTRFQKLDGPRVIDSEGRAWRVTEDALVPVDHQAPPRPRLPARRAFWFGWFAQYPHTALVK